MIATNPHLHFFQSSGAKSSYANPHMAFRLARGTMPAAAFNHQMITRMRVLVHGLKAKPELNGAYGTAIEYNTERERVAVLFDDYTSDGPLLVKIDNISIVPYAEVVVNTPPFAAALGVGAGAEPNIATIKEMLNAGHILHTRPAPMAKVIMAAIRTYQGWGSFAEEYGQIPNPLFVRIAMEAGIKTEGALEAFFSPEQVKSWTDGSSFRAALEKHLGLQPSGGAQLLPLFLQIASEQATVELMEANSKGLQAIAELYTKHGGKLGEMHIADPTNRLY